MDFKKNNRKKAVKTSTALVDARKGKEARPTNVGQSKKNSSNQAKKKTPKKRLVALALPQQLRMAEAKKVLKSHLHTFFRAAAPAAARLRLNKNAKISPLLQKMTEHVENYTNSTIDHQEEMVEEMAHKLVSEPVPHHAEKERNAIVDVLVEKEMQEKKDEKWLSAALMDSFRYENLGWPDQYNAAPCGRPKIMTHVTVPFDANGEARLIVSDDPKEHITVLGGGASDVYSTSTYTNRGSTGVSNQWAITSGSLADVAPVPVLTKDGSVIVDDRITPSADPVAPSYTTPSYATAGGVSVFFYKNGMLWDPDHPHVEIPIDTFDIGGTRYEGVRCKPSDSVSITAVCTDTSSNNLEFNAFFIKSDGTTGVGTPVLATGGGAQASAAITAPALAVAVYGYSITNKGQGFTGSKVQAFSNITVATGDLVYPVGAADGTDVAFIDDYADEFRTTSMSTWTEYFGSQLSNGILVQGQFPDGTGDDLPPASLQNWARIPGFINKALGGEDPGAFTWCFPHSVESLKFHNLEEDTQSFERVGIYIKANDADAQNVQIHTAVDFSVRSNNQFYPQEPGLTDEDAIEELLAVLSLFPNTTSNAEHESVVDDLIRVVSSVANTYSFLNGNSISLAFV